MTLPTNLFLAGFEPRRDCTLAPNHSIGVMTQSDLTGNSERPSEMAVRRERSWSVLHEKVMVGESNRRVDTLVVPAVNVEC